MHFSRICIHRAVLSRSSEYFRALFDTAFKEKDQSEFSIPEIDGDVLKVVVEFCYHGVIEVDDINVEPLLIAASYLQIRSLETHCIQHYKRQIKVSNCLSIWTLAEKYFFIDLEKAASSFVFRKFREVLTCVEFLRLDSNQLSTILKSDNLKVDCEEQVFYALMAWIRFDKVNRKVAFKTLVENIRLHHVKESVSATF